MANHNHTALTDPTLALLARLRRKVSLARLGGGYVGVALVVVGLMFAGVLLDHAVVLQKGGRVTFFRFLMLSFCVTLLVATFWPLMRRLSPLYLARRIETSRPELRNLLTTYLQCRTDRRTPTEVKKLLGLRAAESLRGQDAESVVDYTPLRRFAVALGVLTLVALAYSVLSPKSTVVSVERLLWPRADIHPPTATRLTQVEPGEAWVVRGTAPQLLVSVGGVRPEAVYALWQTGDQPARRMLLNEGREGAWSADLPPLLEDSTYYVVAADTRSDRFTIHTVPRPVVESVSMQLVPPAYTGLPDRTVDDQEVTVPEGTTVLLTVRTSVPAERGYLQRTGNRRTWLMPRADGTGLGGEFTVVKSESFTVHFESPRYPDGSVFRNLSPLTYRIHCAEDEAPRLEVLAPPDGARVKPDDVVALRYSVSDDHGLSAVRLRYSVNGSFLPPVPLAVPSAASAEDQQYEWDLAQIPARGGQVIAYYVEADDNRPQAPNTGHSPVRRLFVERTGPGKEPSGAPPGAAEQPPQGGGARRAAAAERLRSDEREAPVQQSEPRAGQPPGQRQDAEPPEGEAQSGQAPDDDSAFEAFLERLRELRRAARPDSPKADRELDPTGEKRAEGEGGRPGTASGGGSGSAIGEGQSDAAPETGTAASGSSGSRHAPRADSTGAEPGGSEAGESGAQGADGEDNYTATGERPASAGAAEADGAAGEAEIPTSDQESGGGGVQGEGAARIAPPGEPEDRPLRTWEDLDAAVRELETMAQQRDAERAFQDLGINREKLREFIQEYRSFRRRSQAGAEPEPSAGRGEEPGRLLRGEAADRELSAGDASASKGESDELRARFERAAELPPRWRETVDQYYRALSEER